MLPDVTRRIGRLAIAAGLAASLAAGLLATTAGQAAAYSDRVEKACKSDYYRFCAAYQVGSASLRACMQSNADNLTRTCVRALIDGGYVDRRRVKRAHR